MTDAMAMPPVFFSPMNWSVVKWIIDHRIDFVVWGLRWIAASILFAVVWMVVMHFFGHERDDDE